MDEYYQYAATAKTIGIDVRFLTPDEILKLWPMCNIDGLVGGIVHPDDGYIQPADLTQALAKGARARVRPFIAIRGSEYRADVVRGLARADGKRRHHLRTRYFGNRQLRAADGRMVGWMCRSFRLNTNTS